ncbi:MAG: histidinol-phosphate transaminase [Myxococcota bacterium]|jgi:histidinol-phosphate aminotransferase|nr:histidinol-phosphate transaminase [Myxococcota bacterium]
MAIGVESHIEVLVPYVPGKPIEELQRELGLDSIIKLASNENPFGPSPLALEAARRAVEEVHIYPDGSAFALKQRLARHLQVNAEQLIIGNGSNEILHLLLRTFRTPQAHAVVSAHAFVVYKLNCIAAKIPFDEVPSRDWGHDLEAFPRYLKADTRFIFLVNPNNPTGNYFKRQELEKLLEQVGDETLVVIDEAYFEFVDRADYPNALDYLKRYPNLVVLRTFSKCYGLAGLRVGYAVMHPRLANYVNRVRDPFNVNLVAQRAATAALDDVAFLEQTVANNHKGLRTLTEGLRGLGLKVTDSVGNFVLVELPYAGKLVFSELLQRGVIIRPLDNYGMPSLVRISVGKEEENVRCVSAMGQVLEALASHSAGA